jgi:hypothetical protein
MPARLRAGDNKRRAMDSMTAFSSPQPHGCYEDVIDAICAMAWDRLGNDEVLQVAKAYYYFSIQFRENLDIACALRPGDPKLASLREGECDTDNLSPWPGIAATGEKMHHDEFMRRLLSLQTVRDAEYLEALGTSYLNRVRSIGDLPRACSIASYEDGGLSRVFTAMLRAPHWYGAGQRAFRYFLEQHIRFDTDDAGGHGSLSRHLTPDESIMPLWSAFALMLASAVPRLMQQPGAATAPGWRNPAVAWAPVAAASA